MYDLCPGNRIFCQTSILVFFVSAITLSMHQTKFTEAKFFDPSSTKIYCVLRLGPRPDQQDLDQENRATTLCFQVGAKQIVLELYVEDTSNNKQFMDNTYD